MYIVSTIIFVIACFLFIGSFQVFLATLIRMNHVEYTEKLMRFSGRLSAVSFTYMMVYLFIL